MNEFSRIKMGFVVALLAALFMLRPLIETWYSNGFAFFGVHFLIQHVYYLFSALLGLAAYFYAMDMVGRRSSIFVQGMGNTLYALAILVPPFYLLMGVIVYLSAVLLAVTKSSVLAYGCAILLTLLVAILGGACYRAIRNQMREQDNTSTMERLGAEEAQLMAKANGLLEAGLYDLVLMESFRAVETALKRRLVAHNVAVRKNGVSNLLNEAEKRQLIAKTEREYVHDMRVLRNAVTHEGKQLSRDEAEQALDVTRRVVTALEKRG